MGEHSKERSFSNLDYRIESLGTLIDEAAGNFLNANDPVSAKKFLFEIFFLRLASTQAEESRLRSESRLPDIPESIGEFKGIIDKIRQQGDWRVAKREIVDFFLANDLTYDNASKWGFDKDFSYSGIRIFSKDPLGTLESANAFTQFIEDKVSIIPDETEPYDYPQITELKNKVEFGI